MWWTLLCLCLFTQTYAAPIEEQGATSDVSQHQEKKDDVYNFRKRLKQHTHLQETIPNHQANYEGAKENLALPKDQQTSVVSFVDLEKSYPETRHEIVHKHIDNSQNIHTEGIRNKSPKLNASLELIFHDSQVTVDAVRSKKKKDIEHASVRPENFSPISISFPLIPEKDGNTTPDNKYATYYAGADKGAPNDTVGYKNTEGNDNTVSGIKGQDAGMSSGSGDYYTEEITSTNLDKEDGHLSSTAPTTVSSDHTEALDNREEVNGTNHDVQVATNGTEAVGKQKHSACHNSATGMDKRKITHCNTFVAANKTSICIEFGNSGDTKHITDLPSACKNMSCKAEASSRAKNVDAQTIHYSKRTPNLRGHGGHSRPELENNYIFRKSKQGNFDHGPGKSSRQMNFPMHVKLPKRKFTNGQINYDSNSSLGSSSESGQSGSDSSQSK